MPGPFGRSDPSGGDGAAALTEEEWIEVWARHDQYPA